MRLQLPRIYPITDTRLSGLSHAEQVERLADGGATLIQLREKHASPREFYNAAVQAVKIARRCGVLLIINDRVDVALAVGADGVHLGQEDLPPDRARRVLGSERIIGVSTHNLEQARAADSMPVDYVAVGPVFATTTKENPDVAIGLSSITQIRSIVSKPLVAIGGISVETAHSVIEAGADCLAIVSDLYSSGEVSERVKTLIAEVA